MRLVALLAVLCIAPSAASAQDRPAPDHEALHAVPVRYADRPLTLPEGSFRLDQSAVLRVGSQFGLSGPNTLSVGLSDWLELGVAWPYTRDPTFLGTVRLAHSSGVDFAVRVAVTTPAITTGDTDLIVSIPVVFRIAHIARVATGVSGDFLLTQTMHPIVRLPFSIVFSASARHFVGIDAALSLADRRFWHGEVGVFYGHTLAATPLRPLGEVRLGATLDIASSLTFVITVGFSFWATVNPVEH